MNFFLKYFVITIVSALSVVFFADGMKKCEIKEAKKLESKWMYVVDMGIWWSPNLMIKAWDAKESAQNILAKINNPESDLSKDFVQKNRDQLVGLIDEFLSPFRKKKIIVVPLFQESLGENSMLERLFNTDSSISIKSFFEKEVQSMPALNQMCAEFVIFYNDLEMSLSFAKKAYEKELENHKLNIKKKDS